MKKIKLINKFSKLSWDDKISFLKSNYLIGQNSTETINKVLSTEQYLEKISENVITNFSFPYSIVPNFKIDNKVYVVPMVTEESSVVAAAAKGAKFWFSRGGFKTNVISTNKIGQIYFISKSTDIVIESIFPNLKSYIFERLETLNKRIKERNQKIKNIVLYDKFEILKGLYLIEVVYNTGDIMGANFINTTLESISNYIKNWVKNNNIDLDINIIMSIVSNYAPNCLVKCKVECPISEMNFSKNLSPNEFVEKFYLATLIAKKDIKRSVTHNKGIFNGIVAASIATGNDTRAIEAAGHSYASKDGMYKSLTNLCIKNNTFKYELEVPLVLGVKGGVTHYHSKSKLSHNILQNPSSKKLMSIISSVGLANNFSAIAALITDGIQAGHMKLHHKKNNN